MVTLLRQDETCAEHWEELSAVRKVAFCPDSIGEANSFAAPIESQPASPGKAFGPVVSHFAPGPHAAVLFVLDLSLGFD